MEAWMDLSIQTDKRSEELSRWSWVLGGLSKHTKSLEASNQLVLAGESARHMKSLEASKQAVNQSVWLEEEKASTESKTRLWQALTNSTKC
jgi:hypothetical protein